LHGERVGAREGRGPALGGVPRIIGALGHREVGDVLAGPAAGLLVPPHELLALAPGPAPGVGRGAVVEDPPVGGPGPAPVRGGLALLRAGAAAPGLVDPVRVDAGVDPAAAAGGAVVLHLREGVQRAAGPLP